MKMVLLCLLNTALMATGQILFKLGSNGKKLESVIDVLKLFLTPLVFCALCIYAASTGLWLFILNKMPLSRAYPIQALAFPFVLLISMLLFREQITLNKWIGVLLIVAGATIATHY